MSMRDTELHEQKVQYLRAIFDGFPMPAFIVDEAMHVQDFNAAAEPFLGEQPSAALYLKSGEALRCINSEASGCGQAKACQTCVIRSAVRQALRGHGARRQFHQSWVRRGPLVSRLDLLVTTNLLPYTEIPCVLLVLEDLSELKRNKRRGQPAKSD